HPYRLHSDDSGGCSRSRSAAAQRGHRDDLRTRVQGPSGTTGMFDRPGFGHNLFDPVVLHGRDPVVLHGTTALEPDLANEVRCASHFHIDDGPPAGYWTSAQTSGGARARAAAPPL